MAYGDLGDQATNWELVGARNGSHVASGTAAAPEDGHHRCSLDRAGSRHRWPRCHSRVGAHRRGAPMTLVRARSHRHGLADACRSTPHRCGWEEPPGSNVFLGEQTDRSFSRLMDGRWRMVSCPGRYLVGRRPQLSGRKLGAES